MSNCQNCSGQFKKCATFFCGMDAIYTQQVCANRECKNEDCGQKPFANCDFCECPHKFRFKISQMCDRLKEILIAKNSDYGNSANSKPPFVDCSALDGLLVRYGDKMKRLHSLCLREPEWAGETIKDTVMDIAGYSILILLEIEKEEAEAEIEKFADEVVEKDEATLFDNSDKKGEQNVELQNDNRG